MKIAMMGTGGIGGYFGGRLAASGHDVSFVARGAHLEALRRDGLIVASPGGDLTVSPVDATDDTRDLGEMDVVLLCVKTWQVASAAAALTPMVGAHTAVVTLQNGVDAPAEVAAVVGQNAVVPGVAKVIAYVDGPGRIRHVGGGAVTLAEWDNRPSARVEQLRNALSESGVTATVTEDIWAQLWAKFMFVAAAGGLGAVTDAPFGVFRSRPGTRQLLVDAISEVHRVAQAMHVSLPDHIVDTTMAFVDQQPAAGTTSLQRDIRSGRPSELEAWTGSVVRLGRETGIPTPVNSFFYEVLSLVEANR